MKNNILWHEAKKVNKNQKKTPTMIPAKATPKYFSFFLQLFHFGERKVGPISRI